MSGATGERSGEWRSALAAADQLLLDARNSAGHWEGHLASSALSTATAVVALHKVDAGLHAGRARTGRGWLVRNQNADGGWGDTTASRSNLSTTLLCWSALRLEQARDQAAPEDLANALQRASAWIERATGSLEPEMLRRAVEARYGKDRTFSVPILMLCALCGSLGPPRDAWRRVMALPFELAALPREWFGRIGLPVVSYALPALIAIGHARFFHAPPAWWNPWRRLRSMLWPRIRPMLAELQPASGGYLEATPLTSFVTMALAGAGQVDHPCVGPAVDFLERSQRADGSWPIDTNLATWGTTLAIRSGVPLEAEQAGRLSEWLLGQQYHETHPFTNAAPGGWAWTDLSGGVPDADDTPGALLALRALHPDPDERVTAAAVAGLRWLVDLQNRDGGMPTFCRGWGTLPFDRSTPELTAHALGAWTVWRDRVADPELAAALELARGRALHYLTREQRTDGSWIPLWFGNEHTATQENPVYGAAQVINHLCEDPWLAQEAADMVRRGAEFLLAEQQADGAWGGDRTTPPSIEETAVASRALARAAAINTELGAACVEAARRGADWLARRTRGGRDFEPAPIGLYFASLWYHERLYPLVWTVAAWRDVLAWEEKSGG